eukprot:9452411-Pyramimonas_sp.AAC.1
MLYRTELFDIFILVQSAIAAPVLGASHSTIGTCALVECTLTESIFHAFVIFVHGVPSTGHTNVINMPGRETVIARLELLVVGRGSEAKSSGGSSELK